MTSTPSRYQEVYGRWQADPEGFWAGAAEAIAWDRPADRVFDPEAGVYGRWFVGATCKICSDSAFSGVVKTPILDSL